MTDAPPVTRYLDLLGCRIDLAARVARWHDGDRSITPTETKLLAYLASQDGRAVSRQELLKEVWGYRGGVISRTVKTTMGRLRAKVEIDPAQPDHLLTVVGLGYRFHVADAVAVAVAREELSTHADRPAPLIPDDEPVDATRCNLPPAGDLVGRQEAAAPLAVALDEGRIATLIGPAGVGKSALALSWATDQAGARRWDEVAWIDLANATSRGDLLRAIADALGSDLQGEGDDAARFLGGALAGRGRLLLVLDNAEQAAESLAAALPGLLDPAPRVSVVVTSREPLRIRGERQVAVAPLTAADAARLFARRIPGTPVPGYEDPAVVGPILECLDGLPLAIEMAAVWADLLGPDELRDRLDQQLDLLQEDRRDRPERHRSLRAAVASSWELLGAWERSALGQLAAFEGAFDLDEAHAVLRFDDPEAPTAPAALRSLRSRSLLRLEPGARTRFRLFRAVRAFATEDGLEPGAAARHGAHFARWGDPALLARLDRGGAQHELEKLAADRADLVAAGRRAQQRGDPDLAAAAVRALGLLAAFRGPSHGDPELIDRCLAAGGGPDLFWERGRLRLMAGDLRGAEADLEAAVAGAASPEALRARALARRREDPAAALEFADAAVAAAELAGEPGGWGRALAERARCLQLLGQLEEAESAFEDALSRLVQAEDRRFGAIVLGHLGDVHLAKGRPLRAGSIFEEALTAQRDAGHRQGEGALLARIAGVRRLQGDTVGARHRLAEGLEITRRTGHRQLEAQLLVDTGSLDLAEGRTEAARGHLRAALVLARQVRDRAIEARALHLVGELELSRGRLLDASTWLRAAVGLARETGLVACEGEALGGLGELQAADGMIPEARESLARGNQLLSEAGERVARIRLLERWAEVEAAAGNEQQASDLMSQSLDAAELSVVDGPARLRVWPV